MEKIYQSINQSLRTLGIGLRSLSGIFYDGFMKEKNPSR